MRACSLEILTLNPESGWELAGLGGADPRSCAAAAWNKHDGCPVPVLVTREALEAFKTVRVCLMAAQRSLDLLQAASVADVMKGTGIHVEAGLQVAATASPGTPNTGHVS